MSRRAGGTLSRHLFLVTFVQLVLVIAGVLIVGALIGPPRHQLEQAPQQPPRRPSPLSPVLVVLGFGVVIVGAGTFFTSRGIVRPLRQLSAAARALGAGDLSSRAGIDREDEIGDVARSFDEMADRIHALLRSEKELLANVSHELRTPLARIRVALDLAAEGDSEAARSALAEIALDLSEIEALVDDVLTATRVQLATDTAGSGSFILHCQSISPVTLLERAIDRLRSRHPERSLEVQVEGEIPEIEADPVLVRRAIDNLLDNAHKYSPDPNVPVRCSLSAEGGAVIFEVSDRGRGIHADDLPHLFKPFFRSDRSRSRNSGGVGLGLTLVKRIVEAHGGSVSVASEVGTGTTVRIVLAGIEPSPALRAQKHSVTKT